MSPEEHVAQMEAEIQATVSPLISSQPAAEPMATGPNKPRCAADLLAVFSDGRAGLPPYHSMALVMIATKLSRILTGGPDFRDHWDDIAGYAKLASARCSK